jgi:hypothetical protein
VTPVTPRGARVSAEVLGSREGSYDAGMRARGLGIVLAVLLVSAPPAAAQRAPRIAQTTTLDVIGPRSTASVRAWLARSSASLADCRAMSDVPVDLSLAIGADGALVERTVRGDQSDPVVARAGACVIEHLAGWRMPGRGASVTTVAWSLTLVGTGPVCQCFSWIHGGDFGMSCATTRADCEREIRETGREHTECRALRRERCDDHATIDGATMTHR